MKVFIRERITTNSKLLAALLDEGRNDLFNRQSL